MQVSTVVLFLARCIRVVFVVHVVMVFMLIFQTDIVFLAG